MSTICMEHPNTFEYQKGNHVDECRVENKVSIIQNMFNFNNLSKNELESRFPYPGVIPQGPATGSWPCRNQTSCNYFEANNPNIPEHIRQIDLMSLPPN